MQTSDPESLGFSAERLAYIRSWHQAQIDAGGLTGAVVAIARYGEIAYLEAVGTQDWEKRIPMTADAIFWIASMTKPVTSVAAMVLVEEGTLDLDSPVYRYLPTSRTCKWAWRKSMPKRPMTVRDLLQHTSG